ncbi:hypothetical protein [Coleofasciculus sp.]|uniref:hypothetical protein n=1 Tax=Coleofasciculus sp. TaxID=3100458 RepID=UPI0039FB1F10
MGKIENQPGAVTVAIAPIPQSSLIFLKLKLVNPQTGMFPYQPPVRVIRRGRGTIAASVEKDWLFFQ